MKVIIVRHAQTDENLGEVQIGQQSEVLLNEEGLAQVRKLAEFLQHETIHVAYTSPQKRAVHTAQEVLKFHPTVTIIEAPHLKEQHLGIYESLGRAQWKEIKKNSKEPFHTFKPPQGESYTELQARAVEFFNDLAGKHPQDTVLVVSHGGTLGVLLLHILGKELTQENYKANQPQNTAVTILEIDQSNPPKVHLFNSLEHLN